MVLFIASNFTTFKFQLDQNVNSQTSNYLMYFLSNFTTCRYFNWGCTFHRLHNFIDAHYQQHRFLEALVYTQPREALLDLHYDTRNIINLSYYAGYPSYFYS